MKQLIAYLCCVLLCSTAAAQSGNMSVDQATSLGGQVGQSLNPSVTQGINSGGGKNVVPGYGTDASQKQYYQGGTTTPVGPGTARVAGCTGQNDLECQAVNLLKDGPQTRPQFDVKNDPLVARAKALTKNPTGITGDIFSTYETCTKSIREIAPLFETQICNEFSYTENMTCTMGQNVVVDPDWIYKCIETIQSQANATCSVGRVVNVQAGYNYQCDITNRAVNNYTCNKTLIVQCTPAASGNCANGGIVPGSVILTNGNYEYSFDGTTMRLHNAVTAVNSTTSARFAFGINGLARVNEFTLTGIISDNWVAVKINGTFIGLHTRYFGGLNRSADRLVQGTVMVGTPQGGYNPWPAWCWSGNQPADCKIGAETGDVFQTDENVDLRPYLIEGNNTIEMIVLNGGGPGHGTILIRANQYCPVSCSESWDNQCAGLESRS